MENIASTDIDKDISYFEKSLQYHDSSTTNNSSDAILDYQMLTKGLDLNSDVFNPRALNNEHIYSEECTAEQIEEKQRDSPEKYILCTIYIESPNHAFCIPVEPRKDVNRIEVTGRSKAGRTFTGDEVVVEILNLGKENQTPEKRYGKVVRRVNCHHFKETRHPVFVCVLDNQVGNVMIPLCKSIPKIHIYDRHAKEESPHKNSKNVVDVYHYNRDEKKLVFEQLQFVPDENRDSFVFLVAFLTWNRHYQYPLGAVVQVLTSGSTNIDTSLRVLDAMYGVPNIYGKQTVEQVNHILSKSDRSQYCASEKDRVNYSHLHAFTVDPDNAKALDDALSIEINEDRDCVGIHVTDVTTVIKKNDPTDVDAQKRGNTFYPNIGKPRRLLPEPLSENAFSLLPNQKRNCLSVFFYFNKDGKMIGSQNMCRSIIQSRVQFSYIQVQKILEGKANKFDPTITTYVQRLFKIATVLRKNRLLNAMYAIKMKDSDTFEAHFLVEEFMILANKYVAEKLLVAYPKQVPLLCQNSPSNSEVENWYSEHEGIVDVLLSLQDRLLIEGKIPSFQKYINNQDDRVVHISDAFLSVLCTNYEIDIEKATKMMKIDELHPLQFIALHQWLSMQNKATYKCSSNVQNISVDAKCFNVNVCPYTHFTSPLRRYVDMVVHRMVHCMLQKKPCCYTQKDVEKICCNSNEQISKSEIYEEKCKALILAENLKTHPKLCTCIIMCVSDEGITLITCGLGEFQTFLLPFKLLDITTSPIISKDTNNEKNIVSVEWRKRLYDRHYSVQRLPYKDYTKQRQIDPHKELVFVSINDWATGLEKLVQNRPDELAQVLRGIANRVHNSYIPGRENIVNDVSTEDFRNGEAVAPYAFFSKTFSYGQIVTVQISADFQRGRLTPRPQIFEMTKNIHFCLHHTDDPVKWLYRYSKLPTNPTYTRVDDYKRRWISLELMEAAVSAVNEEGSYVINNLSVQFTKDLDGFRGRFKIPINFCRVRNIVLDRRDYVTDDDESGGRMKKPVVNKSRDWLCVRSKVATYANKNMDIDAHNYWYWIAHGEVASVETDIEETRSNGHSTSTTYATLKDGKEKTRQFVSVDFELHPDVSDIPTSSGGTHRLPCSVEMLIKSDVDRRTESCLQILDDASVLTKAIALGKMIPTLDPEHIRVSYLSAREVPFTSLYKNNQNQSEAIDKALSSAFSLIQGPPGTGKSYTAIKLIYLFSKINSQVKKKEQVLFCGPSNKSVDNIASWMRDNLKNDFPDIVRLYGRSIEALEYPIPGAVFTSSRSMRDLKAAQNLRAISIHHLIRKTDRPFAEEIAEFDRKFSNKDYIPHYEEVSKYRSLIRKATVEELQQHEIILCTTGVATSPKLLMGTNIYQLIIDEAGMCQEPQCMASIIANQPKQVVLIGDHKQLRPIIKCREAAKLGMNKSLFERYAEDLKLTNDERNVQFTFLNTQYRMHPRLCEFPSNEFYDKELETAVSVLEREDILPSLTLWPVSNVPHVFCHVEGREEMLTVSTEKGNEKSRSNNEEVKQVVKIFKHLVEVEKIDVKDVNVISQYNAQCHALRQEFIKKKYENFTVNTVVASQGGEWDYVIFSTVRSLPVHEIESTPSLGWCAEKLGFILDRHQINVALTRAKRGLIIVGNKNLLMCDRVWKKLVQQYEVFNCVVSSVDFPTRSLPTPM
ncbi:hypothetical protein CHS0354_026454 [Potamilus streckersoni]|uniref:RNB domain-containing protein n=1 Tax=Potamilus streckersoni TaxID=2493646 RepID=A0AAE0VI21_9BIVA|nr:hypothetical protein CHS0354_026454 [Potamilus streckersoni]